VRFRTRTLPVAGALLVLLLACGTPPAWPQDGTPFDEEIETNQEQLETLRRQAEAKRKKAHEYARKEKGVVASLNEVEEALAATRKYIRKLDATALELEQVIRKTTVELSWAQDELVSRRAELGERLRYTYMHGRTQVLEVVFSAQSFPDLLQRTALMERVFQQDQRLIEQVRDREADVKGRLEELKAQQEELRRLEREKEAEEAQYASLKGEREADLAKVRNERSAHEQAAKELETAAARLEGVLAELERRRKESLRRNSVALAELDRQDFSRNRGKLPWPVDGKVVTPFGRLQHPKYKTVTVSKGIDIEAPLGTPVRAVGDAVVDLVQWIPGYGETIILNHGLGYYSIYGHLSAVSVAPDDRVEPGQVIGAVGDTGSLKGANLHFEIRQKGEALDPTGWLR